MAEQKREGSAGGEQPKDQEGSPRTKKGFLRRHWKPAVLGGVVVLVLIVAYWWFFMRNKVSTDDAYVHANVARVSTRVPGTVNRVLVEDNDPVRMGDTLVELDPTDYQVEERRIQAALDRFEADIRATEVQVQLTDEVTAARAEAAQAALEAAKENLVKIRHQLTELQNRRMAAQSELELARRDFERFENLFAQGAGSERRREEARTTLDKTQASVGAVDAQIAAQKAAIKAVNREAHRARADKNAAESDRKQVEIERRKLESMKAQRDQAKAELEAAKLNVSYTTIQAPIAGYVAQRTVQAGDRVGPGQQLMSVVPLGYVYVEANYKETELTDVRLGQPVKLQADIYPGYTYHGKVAGIAAGTGAAFSLLPPENASGNWVKVVRRVPVRIHLDAPPPADYPLRIGLSMIVTIDTSDKKGALLITGPPAPPPFPSELERKK